MEYKKTYEKYWIKAKEAKFEDYERNLALDSFFPKVEKPLRVLDVAGGAGIVSLWLKERGYDVALLEFSDTAIDEARKKGIENIIHHVLESGPLPFEDNSFDAVFLGDIIEHLFNPELIIQQAHRVLKKNGQLVISCPNMAYWRFRTYYLIDGDFERIDVAKQKPWEQEHIRFYTMRILKEFLAHNHFTFVKFKGVNTIWHSKMFVKMFPSLFAHTIIAEFKK